MRYTFVQMYVCIHTRIYIFEVPTKANTKVAGILKITADFLKNHFLVTLEPITQCNQQARCNTCDASVFSNTHTYMNICTYILIWEYSNYVSMLQDCA